MISCKSEPACCSATSTQNDAYYLAQTKLRRLEERCGKLVATMRFNTHLEMMGCKRELHPWYHIYEWMTNLRVASSHPAKVFFPPNSKAITLPFCSSARSRVDPVFSQLSCSSTVFLLPTAHDDSLMLHGLFFFWAGFYRKLKFLYKKGRVRGVRPERVSQTVLEQSRWHVLWGRCGCLEMSGETTWPVGACGRGLVTEAACDGWVTGSLLHLTLHTSTRSRVIFNSSGSLWKTSHAMHIKCVV